MDSAEPSLDRIDQFILDAEARGIAVIHRYHEGDGHVLRGSKQLEERLRMIARFVKM